MAALTADDALSLARDAYSASTTYFDSSIRREIEADIRRFQGQHPMGSKYLSEVYRAKSRLFRPKTRTALRKHEAIAAEAFFSNRDVVSIEPQDDNDPVQMASASLHKELLQFRLTKTIPWFLTAMGAYQDAMNVGLVCSYQHWIFDEKKGKDEPCIRLIPIENVRFDPGANWLNPVETSPYFIEMIPMYVKDVQARTKQDDAKTGEKRWRNVAPEQFLTAVRGYSDSIRLQREQGRTDPKENVNAVKAYNIVWVHKNIVDYDGVDYCYYTLGDQLLLSDPVPLKQRYHHGRRPYVIGYSVIETHKNYPGGPNRIGRDVQAEINEVANQRIENVKLVLNKRYLVGRNRQVDIRSLTKNVAGSATLVNDVEKDVRELEFSDVTASSYKEQEVLNLDHDDAVGNFSQSSVQSNRKMNETVGGMQLLTTDANQVAGYQLRTFVETWVEPVLRQLVLLEQAYETDEVILALVGQKAKLDELGFDTITDELIEQELILSVNVGMGATNPQEKVNRLLTAVRALKEIVADGTLITYGLKFDEVAKEVFSNLGYKDGTRFFDTEGQDPQVAGLMGQIKQLQQQLEAKQPQALIDAQVRHIDAQIASLEPKNKLAIAQAVKTGVDASYSAMQAAEVVAAVPQAAPVADTIMQGAGYTMPTPPGQDPNIGVQAGGGTPNSAAAAVAPAGGISTQPIENHRTGVVTTLPGSGQPGGPAQGDTSPQTPATPPTAGTGESKGVETMRADGAPRGMANGGITDGYGTDAFGNVVNLKKALKGEIDIPDFQESIKRDNIKALIQSGTDHRWAQANAAAAAAPSPAPAPNMGSEVYGASNLAAPIDSAPQTISSVAHKAVGLGSGALGSGTYGLNDDLSKPITFSFANGGMVGYRLHPMGGAVGMADGGMIAGPGTGTSDSIPAVNTQTGEQTAVSNGEYKIPARVVAVLGADFFEHLIAKYHQPVDGEPQADQNSPALGLEPGAVIIPADVVAALGRDFFDELVQQFGGAK